MARGGVEILNDDEEADLASFMLEACGIDSCDFLLNERLLTRDNFEKNYKVLEKMVEGRNFRRAPYFVFGYLALITGARISEKMREEILEATRWEHEKEYWSDENFATKRKIYIEDFQDKIRLHKPGQQLHPITLWHSNKDFKNGHVVIGLNQFKEFCKTGKIYEVKHVNLDGLALKEIPEEIFELRNLKELSLEFNQISQISDKISNLKSLKHLSFSYNHLQALPTTIGELSSLKSISIIHNDISVLPESIKNLTNLEHIYVRGTRIKELPRFLEPARFDPLNDTIYL